MPGEKAYFVGIEFSRNLSAFVVFGDKLSSEIGMSVIIDIPAELENPCDGNSVI
jgi:hypothetical protein